MTTLNATSWAIQARPSARMFFPLVAGEQPTYPFECPPIHPNEAGGERFDNTGPFLQMLDDVEKQYARLSKMDGYRLQKALREIKLKARQPKKLVKPEEAPNADQA